MIQKTIPTNTSIELEMTCLAPHLEMYIKSNTSQKLKIKTTIEYLNKTKIDCFKYNYALEDTVQNFGSFQSYIEIKGEELIITNLKPVTKKQYILDPDPKKVREIRDQFKNKNRSQKVPFRYQPNKLEEHID